MSASCPRVHDRQVRQAESTTSKYDKQVLLADHLQAATSKAANEDDLLGCLTDVNEASAAGSAWGEV